MKSIKLITAAVLSIAMLAGCGESGSSSDSSNTDSKPAASSQESASNEESSEKETAPAYKSIKLMTFGDSITDGFWLSGGYRKFLCDKLEENGLSQYVDFVGSKKGGECYDNEHEGYTGWSIDRIQNSITGARMGISSVIGKRIEKYQPDVVTLMIGTNDILSDYELDKSYDRLSALVDKAFEKMPEGAVLIMATIPDMDATDNTYIDKSMSVEYMDKCIANYNDAVRAVAEDKKAEGKNIMLADVHSAITKEDLYDGVHPNEEGYKKIAYFWYDVITDYIKE